MSIFRVKLDICPTCKVDPRKMIPKKYQTRKTLKRLGMAHNIKCPDYTGPQSCTEETNDEDIFVYGRHRCSKSDELGSTHTIHKCCCNYTWETKNV